MTMDKDDMDLLMSLTNIVMNTGTKMLDEMVPIIVNYSIKKRETSPELVEECAMDAIKSLRDVVTSDDILHIAVNSLQKAVMRDIKLKLLEKKK